MVNLKIRELGDLNCDVFLDSFLRKVYEMNICIYNTDKFKFIIFLFWNIVHSLVLKSS